MTGRHILILSLLCSLFITGGLSLPRFAIGLNEKCQNCHVDPNGGGMRNYYGAAVFAKQVLTLNEWADDSTMQNFTTQLNEFVSFGTDLRTIFYYRQQNDYSSFYQMQGDIYLRARLGKNLSVYFDKGLYHGFEVFGLVNVLPANGYFKIGRFTPAYGTKIDDHTAFIRDKTDFQNNRREDTGIEIGISPSSFTWNVGIYNGQKENDFSAGKIQMFTTRAEMKFKVDRCNLSLGSSLWYNNAPAGSFTMFGGFGAASYGRTVLNAEIDLKEDKAVLRTKELISYLELNYMAIDGMYVKFMYDFYDPDINLKSGSISRYSLGVEFFPIYGIEIRPLFRIPEGTPGNASNKEFDVLFHFYL